MHGVKIIVWIVFSMRTLWRPKIALLNLDMHQFSYSDRLIHLKKHLKRSLFTEFRVNPMSHFSSMESLPKREIGIPNVDFYHYLCSKQLIFSKWHLKGNYYMFFEENHSSRFFEHALSKSKIGLPNMDFNEFFCDKRLIHSEWLAKRYLFIEFEENCYSRFWDNQFWSHFRSVLTHFRFLDFLQNQEVLSMQQSGSLQKIWCFYFH